MLLSDSEIIEEVGKGNIKIEPFDKSLVGPDNLDVRLGATILIAKKKGIVDVKNISNFFEEKNIEDGYVIEPGTFLLGSTMERFSLPNNIAAQIEGRSSLGRIGLMVHVTAGIIHAGFGLKEPSSLTLEIYSVNPNPIKIYPGMKIAQLSFFRLGKEASLGYDQNPKSKYLSQKSPVMPKGDWMGFEKFKEEELKVEKKNFKRIEVDVANIEIKKIWPKDIDIVLPLLVKAQVETTKEELKEILADGVSFGAFVDRILGGIALSWNAHFDEDELDITDGEENAIHIEELIVLFVYESKNLRERLLNRIITEAKAKGYKYVVSFVENINMQTRHLKSLNALGFKTTRKGELVVAFKVIN